MNRYLILWDDPRQRDAPDGHTLHVPDCSYLDGFAPTRLTVAAGVDAADAAAHSGWQGDVHAAPCTREMPHDPATDRAASRLWSWVRGRDLTALTETQAARLAGMADVLQAVTQSSYGTGDIESLQDAADHARRIVEDNTAWTTENRTT